MNTLQRRLHWFCLTALGLGGGNLSILVMSSLISDHGTLAVPLLIVGFLLGVVAALGYAELVLMYPHKVGGIAAVCLDAFRRYNPMIANIAGTCYWFAWTVFISFAAIFLSHTVQTYFLPWISVNLFSSLLILGAMLLAFFGMHWVERIAVPIAAAAATLMLIAVLIPVLHGQVNWEQSFQYNMISAFNDNFGRFSSIMACLYLIGWIAPAFEVMFCYVGETNDPQKNVPLALYVIIGVAMVYFICYPLVWLGVFNEATFLKNMLGEEVVFAFKPLMGHLANALSAWLIIFNMLICMIAPMTGPPRTLFQLSVDGLLPKFFNRISSQGVPVTATLLTAFVALLIVWLGAPNWLVVASNYDYLIAISLASIAVWLLRYQAPNAKRIYRAPKGFITLGLLTALFWIVTIIFGFQQFGLKTMLMGICFSLIGVVFYLWRKIEDRYELGVPVITKTLHVTLVVPAILVLFLISIAFILAIPHISSENMDLIALLLDIFIIITFLMFGMGIVLPGIVIHAVDEINLAAKRLINGPLTELSKSLQLLASDDLDMLHVRSAVSLIPHYSSDELGQMTACFNQMQIEIKKSMDHLDITCRGLVTKKREYIESNLALHKQVNQTKLELIEAIKKNKKAEVFEKLSFDFLLHMEKINKNINQINALIHEICATLTEKEMPLSKDVKDSVLNQIDSIKCYINETSKFINWLKQDKHDF